MTLVTTPTVWSIAENVSVVSSGTTTVWRPSFRAHKSPTVAVIDLRADRDSRAVGNATPHSSDPQLRLTSLALTEISRALRSEFSYFIA